MTAALTLWTCVLLGAADPAVLYDGSAPPPPVIVSGTADPVTREAGRDLAEYLGRITGVEFTLREDDRIGRGLVVAAVGDFPDLPGARELRSDNPLSRGDRYLLRSHAEGVYLVGATPAAARHAVWDLLHRLGYRLYFPTDTWEIVPSLERLEVAVDRVEEPSFAGRQFGYGHGYWGAGAQRYERWRVRNRAVSPLTLRFGHAYQAIISRNREVFERHPEYLALVDGQRRPSKLCIGNPGLRRLVVEQAVAFFRDNPGQRSISLEPSDGGGWCQCHRCAELGSVSDQAATLANAVAEAAPDRFVCLLAYHLHANPPSISVRSNVLVRVATHQGRGGLTLQQRLAGWRRRGATVGVSDALGTFVWDFSLPAAQRGSDLADLRQRFTDFHRHGASFVGGWTSGCWGGMGLGDYFVARLTWDVKQADHLDAIVAGFLDDCFAGPAREPMTRFFDLLYRTRPGQSRPPMSQDLLGRLYRLLAQAWELADQDAPVRRRIADLALYTGYAQRFFAYTHESGPARQRAFEELARFVYRIRDREMVHGKPVWSYLPRRDGEVSLPAGSTWGSPADQDPWKDSRDFEDAEIAALLRAGVAANDLCDFEPRSFSADLTPAAKRLNLPGVERGHAGVQSGQARQFLYTWLPEPGVVRLVVTGGLIAHYRDRGPVRVSLHSGQAVADDGDTEVARDHDTEPDGQPRIVEMTTPHDGTHWVEVRSGGDRARVRLADPSWPMSLHCDTFHPVTAWSLYFYVPRGTTVVGGYAQTRTGAMLDGDGQQVFAFSTLDRPGHFRVPVKPEQAGRLWKLDRCDGRVLLLTVPPYLSESAEQLLLPREVIEADAGGSP